MPASSGTPVIFLRLSAEWVTDRRIWTHNRWTISPPSLVWPTPGPDHLYSYQTEEEALTAKIIHYFSLGVLQLPEGTTLRAYLAQKLDCDPMRITKKFTGTNCLGKRVYHSCERTTATYEVAKQAMGELAELEERFRARLERNKEKRAGILDIEVND